MGLRKKNKNLYILPQKLTDDKSAIALNKNNTELNQKINGILNQYLSDGTDQVCYSDTYATLHNSVIVPKSMYKSVTSSSNGTITSNEQLNGKRAGIIIGVDNRQVEMTIKKNFGA